MKWDPDLGFMGRSALRTNSEERVRGHAVPASHRLGLVSQSRSTLRRVTMWSARNRSPDMDRCVGGVPLHPGCTEVVTVQRVSFVAFLGLKTPGEFVP